MHDPSLSSLRPTALPRESQTRKISANNPRRKLLKERCDTWSYLTTVKGLETLRKIDKELKLYPGDGTGPLSGSMALNQSNQQSQIQISQYQIPISDYCDGVLGQALAPRGVWFLTNLHEGESTLAKTIFRKRLRPPGEVWQQNTNQSNQQNNQNSNQNTNNQNSQNNNSNTVTTGSVTQTGTVQNPSLGVPKAPPCPPGQPARDSSGAIGSSNPQSEASQNSSHSDTSRLSDLQRNTNISERGEGDNISENEDQDLDGIQNNMPPGVIPRPQNQHAAAGGPVNVPNQMMSDSDISVVSDFRADTDALGHTNNDEGETVVIGQQVLEDIKENSNENEQTQTQYTTQNDQKTPNRAPPNFSPKAVQVQPVQATAMPPVTKPIIPVGGKTPQWQQNDQNKDNKNNISPPPQAPDANGLSKDQAESSQFKSDDSVVRFEHLSTKMLKPPDKTNRWLVNEDVRILLPQLADYDKKLKGWRTLTWALFYLSNGVEDLENLQIDNSVGGPYRHRKYGLVCEESPEYFWLLSKTLGSDIPASCLPAAGRMADDDSEQQGNQQSSDSQDLPPPPPCINFCRLVPKVVTTTTISSTSGESGDNYLQGSTFSEEILTEIKQEDAAVSFIQRIVTRRKNNNSNSESNLQNLINGNNNRNSNTQTNATSGSQFASSNRSSANGPRSGNINDLRRSNTSSVMTTSMGKEAQCIGLLESQSGYGPGYSAAPNTSNKSSIASSLAKTLSQSPMAPQLSYPLSTMTVTEQSPNIGSGGLTLKSTPEFLFSKSSVEWKSVDPRKTRNIVSCFVVPPHCGGGSGIPHSGEPYQCKEILHEEDFEGFFRQKEILEETVQIVKEQQLKESQALNNNNSSNSSSNFKKSSSGFKKLPNPNIEVTNVEKPDGRIGTIVRPKANLFKNDPNNPNLPNQARIDQEKAPAPEAVSQFDRLRDELLVHDDEDNWRWGVAFRLKQELDQKLKEGRIKLWREQNIQNNLNSQGNNVQTLSSPPQSVLNAEIGSPDGLPELPIPLRQQIIQQHRDELFDLDRHLHMIQIEDRKIKEQALIQARKRAEERMLQRRDFQLNQQSGNGNGMNGLPGYERTQSSFSLDGGSGGGTGSSMQVLVEDGRKIKRLLSRTEIVSNVEVEPERNLNGDMNVQQFGNYTGVGNTLIPQGNNVDVYPQQYQTQQSQTQSSDNNATSVTQTVNDPSSSSSSVNILPPMSPPMIDRQNQSMGAQSEGSQMSSSGAAPTNKQLNKQSQNLKGITVNNNLVNIMPDVNQNLSDNHNNMSTSNSLRNYEPSSSSSTLPPEPPRPSPSDFNNINNINNNNNNQRDPKKSSVLQLYKHKVSLMRWRSWKEKEELRQAAEAKALEMTKKMEIEAARKEKEKAEKEREKRK